MTELGKPIVNDILDQRMIDLSYLERRVAVAVKERLQAEGKPISRFNCTLAPEALDQDFDELVDIVYDHNEQATKQIEAWHALPEEQKLLSHLNMTVKALRELLSFCSVPLEQYASMTPEHRELRGKVFDICESTLIQLNSTELFDRKPV